MESRIIIRTSFEKLEGIGWDMDEVYDTAVKFEGISQAESKKWCNEKWEAEVWFEGVDKEHATCQYGVFDPAINESSIFGPCDVKDSASNMIDLIETGDAYFISIDGDNKLEDYA